MTRTERLPLESSRHHRHTGIQVGVSQSVKKNMYARGLRQFGRGVSLKPNDKSSWSGSLGQGVPKR